MERIMVMRREYQLFGLIIQKQDNQPWKSMLFDQVQRPRNECQNGIGTVGVRLCGLDKPYLTVSLELGVQTESPFAPDICSEQRELYIFRVNSYLIFSE